MPTYLFVASFRAAARAAASTGPSTRGGHPQPVVPPPPCRRRREAASLWLLMRAFASGCTAMTGVEAVSNGVSAFREPAVANAHRTLTAIVAILGVLLGGIAYLARAYGIGAMDQTKDGYQSVLSQLAAAVVGRGVFYYVAIGSLLAVLCLSANTSFADFPRLCRLVAQDGFLPQPFADLGRRLVYSLGILFLARRGRAAADRVRRHHRPPDPAVRGRRLPGLHALAGGDGGPLAAESRAGRAADAPGITRSLDQRRRRDHDGLASLILAAKFAEGAWITVLAIPCAIALLKAIRHYYDELDSGVRPAGRSS